MKRIIVAAAALAALTATAHAQSTTSTAGNSTNVLAIAGGGGSGDSATHYSGGIANVPTVVGGVIQGANPCLVGVGAGGAFMGGGFSITVGKSDRGCNMRSNSATLYTMGDRMAGPAGLQLKMAAAYNMCPDDEVKTALHAAGFACPGDAPQAVAAPIAQTVAFVQPAAVSAPVASRPAYCSAYGRGTVPPKECM